MNYTWNWAVLWQSTGVGDSTYLSWILIGLGWLFVIAIVAWSIAMVLGSILGIMRTLPNKPHVLSALVTSPFFVMYRY